MFILKCHKVWEYNSKSIIHRKNLKQTCERSWKTDIRTVWEMTKNEHQSLLCRFDITHVYLPSALRPSSPELCMQCPWWSFKFNDGCQLSLLDLHPGISSEEVVEDVQVQAVLDPDDLQAAADHPPKKLMIFEHGVRHGSISHPPVAIPPPPFGLLGVTLSASLTDRFLACWEYFGASWEGLETS